MEFLNVLIPPIGIHKSDTASVTGDGALSTESSPSWAMCWMHLRLEDELLRGVGGHPCRCRHRHNLLLLHVVSVMQHLPLLLLQRNT